MPRRYGVCGHIRAICSNLTQASFPGSSHNGGGRLGVFGRLEGGHFRPPPPPGEGWFWCGFYTPPPLGFGWHPEMAIFGGFLAGFACSGPPPPRVVHVAQGTPPRVVCIGQHHVAQGTRHKAHPSKLSNKKYYTFFDNLGGGLTTRGSWQPRGFVFKLWSPNLLGHKPPPPAPLFPPPPQEGRRCLFRWVFRPSVSG